jgi:hypothetical protein
MIPEDFDYHVNKLLRIIQREGYDVADINKGYFKNDILPIVDDYTYDMSGIGNKDIKPLYRALVKISLKAEDGGLYSTYNY